MQICCIRFILFLKFSQIRRNNRCNLVKITSLNFDNALYQIIAIFQKSSGSLEWEPIVSNGEWYIVYYWKTVSKEINAGL